VTAAAQDGSGKTGIASVTVTAASVPVASVIVAPSTAVIHSGDTIGLTATVAPTNATDQALVWSSLDETIATVDQTGVVTGVGDGTVRIAATAQDGSGMVGSAVIVVTPVPVVPVDSVTVAPDAAALTVGSTTTLTATVEPTDATNLAVTWSSSDATVASVDQAGVVTAVGPGNATVTATAQDGSGKSGTSTVSVTAPVVPVTSVTVAPSAASLAVGATTALTATVAPTDATNQAVTWSSSDETVATVDQTGVVTAVGPGNATVTATAQDGSGKTGAATVTVTAATVLVTSVTVAPSAVSLAVGGTTALAATVAPTTATKSELAWSSSDATVATVDQTGVVTAIGPGSATVTATAQDGSGKTGTATITVTAPVVPVASPANSTVVVGSTLAPTTGGTARLADGTDAYTITITVRDATGQLMSGQAGIITLNVPGPVRATAVVDNHDGTYTFTVASATAGNYQFMVDLGGVQVGPPVLVNFLSAASLQSTVMVGQSLTAAAFGFQPGEKVTQTAHSTTLDLGVPTADAGGAVTAQFTVPAGFAVGTHTVEFAGAVSGTVAATFQVIAAPSIQTTPNAPQVPTGGTVSGGPVSPLALLSLVAILGTTGLIRRCAARQRS